MKVIVNIEEQGLEQIVESLANGQGVQFGDEQQTPGGRIIDVHRLYIIDSDELLTLGNNPALFHILAFHDTPDAQEGFFKPIEDTWFTPGTPLNDDYQWRLFKWSDLMWVICSVPLEKQHVFYDRAASHGWALSKSIPCLVGRDGGGGKLGTVGGIPLNQFPLATENTVMLNRVRRPLMPPPSAEPDILDIIRKRRGR